VLIDCETLYYLLQREYPVHRFFHSFVGATAAGLVAGLGFLVVVRAFAVAFPGRFASLVGSSSAARGEVSIVGAFAGGLIGGLSHPLLDGIMHADVRPFMPWSDSNPFLGLVGLAPLHLACVAAALVGAACLALWRTRRAVRTG
jgi:LexA-binding, inner membrane-associated putative hydrolase